MSKDNEYDRMTEFFETHSYDVGLTDWEKSKEAAFDPDDDPDKVPKEDMEDAKKDLTTD